MGQIFSLEDSDSFVPQSLNSLCIPLKFLIILRLDFCNGRREDGLQDDESRLCEVGLVWWFKLHPLAGQDKISFDCTEDILCSGPQSAANSGSYSSRHWTIEATKDQEGGRWTGVQGSHSEYTIRPVVWSVHNHDFVKIITLRRCFLNISISILRR